MSAPRALEVRKFMICDSCGVHTHARLNAVSECCFDAVQVTTSRGFDRPGPSRAVRARRRRAEHLSPGARRWPSTSCRTSAASACHQVCRLRAHSSMMTCRARMISICQETSIFSTTTSGWLPWVSPEPLGASVRSWLSESSRLCACLLFDSICVFL